MKRSSGVRPVFDASAVLALMNGENGAEKLLELQPEAMVSSVNMAEVLAKLIQRGIPPIEAQAAYAAMHLETVAFDDTIAQLSARFSRKGVSLGDRCFLATSQLHGTGYTSDRELAAPCSELGVRLTVFR